MNFLLGSLTVNFPEEVKLPILPDQYQTVSLAGAAVNLEYLGVEGAIAKRSSVSSFCIILPRMEGVRGFEGTVCGGDGDGEDCSALTEGILTI